MKNWFIRTFGLPGSWSWAKRQMRKGHVVSCRGFSGTVKYRISDIETNNTLLQWDFSKRANKHNWHRANHFLVDEERTDWYVYEQNRR